MNCVFCVEILFQPNRKVKAASCGHIFHQNCFEDALKKKSECPLCKKRLAGRNIDALHLQAEDVSTAQNPSTTIPAAFAPKVNSINSMTGNFFVPFLSISDE